MIVINAHNINDAYREAVRLFRQEHMTSNSRGSEKLGQVRELGTVTTRYSVPKERILWDSKRDANPFFHLFESIWMLAGRSDVAWLEQFSKNITDFSDEHGAYGNRWRNFFGFDQLLEILALLKRDPGTRRAVLTMWSPVGDLISTSSGAGGINAKDIPCNLMVKFELRRGVLDMIVFNRSNDMLFGAYGANVVHFSMLQEFVAGCLGVEMGFYEQVSANFHVYQSVWDTKVNADGLTDADLYACRKLSVYPLLPDGRQFAPPSMLLQTIETFIDNPLAPTSLPFLQNVARPMYNAWSRWKLGDRAQALLVLEDIGDAADKIDWFVAARRWMERRIRK